MVKTIRGFSDKVDSSLFLDAVAVAAAEFVDATCGVDEFLLAGEERMRRAGDLKLYERIFLAVDCDGLFCGYRGASDEDFVVGHILEHHFAIIGGMNVFFHFFVTAVVVIDYINVEGATLCGTEGSYPSLCNGGAKLENFRDSDKSWGKTFFNLLTDIQI